MNQQRFRSEELRVESLLKSAAGNQADRLAGYLSGWRKSHGINTSEPDALVHVPSYIEGFEEGRASYRVASRGGRPGKNAGCTRRIVPVCDDIWARIPRPRAAWARRCIEQNAPAALQEQG